VDKVLALIAAAEIVSLRLAALAVLLYGLWEFLQFMFNL